MKVLAASNPATETKDLKVALLAAPFIPVPPKGYGGLERIVYDLAIGLRDKGVKVTVFGADESEVEGCEVVTFGPAIGTTQVNWLQAEMERYQRIKTQLQGFDIIHSHDWFGLAYRLRTENPNVRVIHTHHGHIDANWWKTTPAPFPLNLVSISQWMGKAFQSQGVPSRPIYNGIDMGKYGYQEKKGDRLIFVGRCDAFKQPHLAIAVAKKLNLGVDMVCGTFVQDQNYLNYVKGLCDGTQVKWIEDPPQEEKVRLMQDAACLLFPSKMGEPFGLVAAEAMACGTPVAALNDGAIAEVVEDGKTGYIAEDHTRVEGFDKLSDDQKRALEQKTLDELALCVRSAISVNPADCRARAQLFSRDQMAENYLTAYRDILSGREW